MQSVVIKTGLLTASRCDREGRIFQALYDYEKDAREMLYVAMLERNEAAREAYFHRYQCYVKRIDEIRLCIKEQIEGSTLIAKLDIPENTKKQGFAVVFGNKLNADVREIILEEPRLRDDCELKDLIRFLELIVLNCPNMKFVNVITNKARGGNQWTCLERLKTDMKRHNIILGVTLTDPPLDTQIILSNGYVIKLDKGIHYLKYPKSYCTLGMLNYDFRNTHATVIEFFSTNPFHA